MPKLSSQEIDWQSQEDARVMARYEEIMSDSKRKSRAVREAKKQAKDLTARANALNRAAGGSRRK